MGCPTLSEIQAYLEGDEGALLEAYAASSGFDGWQRVLEAVEGLSWPTSYSEDGNAVSMPSEARKILVRSKLADCFWEIRSPAGLRINCHFFDPDEIEFDLDPDELDAQERVDDMCEFIASIGRVLGEPMGVCTEGSEPRLPFLRYEPAVDGIVVADWRGDLHDRLKSLRTRRFRRRSSSRTASDSS